MIKTNIPVNYKPINWELYLKQLDRDVDKMQLWLSPLLLPITIVICLIIVLLQGVDKNE